MIKKIFLPIFLILVNCTALNNNVTEIEKNFLSREVSIKTEELLKTVNSNVRISSKLGGNSCFSLEFKINPPTKIEQIQELSRFLPTKMKFCGKFSEFHRTKNKFRGKKSEKNRTFSDKKREE